MGAVVTASGTGAEMNGGAVITHGEKKIKTGIFAAAPPLCCAGPGRYHVCSLCEGHVQSL